MRIVTANRLSDGRVIYLGEDDRPVESVAEAAVFEAAEAETAQARAAARPEVFVNPYLVEVTGHAFSGRDRLKESIRAAGPTVGNSLSTDTGAAV
ncbi:hypothetical protein BZG35_07195 [Brevundimonas sp. LM2]|uniref:DUF2849 domain-containing protein n=1 Tax=Brevundimonas sp. LM2 TaxID=1938605 RepID=UPI000983EF63|nr:DUF2849 domain-containing protein [Brevundimonas sp. LM2]AQR61458.1 hypothetical protein BZG35_07195 [Brevundimonas sp. LM2]